MTDMYLERFLNGAFRIFRKIQTHEMVSYFIRRLIIKNHKKILNNLNKISLERGGSIK